MATTLIHLLTGYDTVECAYFFTPNESCSLDFELLASERDALKLNKYRRQKPIRLGSEEFLLSSGGTGRGYPFLVENEQFSVEFGPTNKPNFFVTYRSKALWHFGLKDLHLRIIAWAESLGFTMSQPERLSRVDAAFDYHLPVMDFDENHFVSRTTSDVQYRRNRKIQTITFGEGDIVLRVYNKSAEIAEKSRKTWFHALWGGIKDDVWRIEWQLRKKPLRSVGIKEIVDLEERQGDLLRKFVQDHTSLRRPTGDTNASRWPLHPLWQNLQQQVAAMPSLGIVKDCDDESLLEERLLRCEISMYGYLKRHAAIRSLQLQTSIMPLESALNGLCAGLRRIHDPLTWQWDLQSRVDEMRLGK